MTRCKLTLHGRSRLASYGQGLLLNTRLPPIKSNAIPGRVYAGEIAQRYTDAIVTYCEGLRTFSQLGIRRDDIRGGLRITNYKGRTMIAFTANADRVSIIGVFYGGQDYKTVLQINPEE